MGHTRHHRIPDKTSLWPEEVVVAQHVAYLTTADVVEVAVTAKVVAFFVQNKEEVVVRRQEETMVGQSELRHRWRTSVRPCGQH